jgi:hypothetical protein
MPSRNSPIRKFDNDDQSIRRKEIRNWVSIGLSSAKSSPPVRISSLNSSALGMINVCSKLVTIQVVARNTKNSYLPQPLPQPIDGVCWKIIK